MILAINFLGPKRSKLAAKRQANAVNDSVFMLAGIVIKECHCGWIKLIATKLANIKANSSPR